MPCNNVQSARVDKEVEAAFERIKSPAKPTDWAKCKHCKNIKPPLRPYERTWNTSELRNHLAKCQLYLDAMAARDTETQATQKAIQMTEDKGTKKQVFLSSEYRPGAARFNVNTINKLFAKAVYTSNCAFSLFQTNDWLEFFQALSYIPPQRKQLASPLLDEVYKEVKERVEDTWKGASQLGIVADESSNIIGDRIGNISVIHKGTSYFWSNTDLEAEDADADTTVAHIKSEALKIARGDLKRLSSLATDTCNTQRKVWRRFQELPELRHVISVPCDSHGLQLVIKDLIDPGKDEDKTTIPSDIRDFWTSASSIRTHFAKALKQLGLLRSKMISIHGKKRSLLAAGLTRWGTHETAMKSLLANEEPLKMYTLDPRADIPLTLKNLILDESFWQRLKALHKLISPIAEFQKMSESDHATLDKVLPRWMKLADHMLYQSQDGASPFAHEVKAYMTREKSGWKERVDKQLQSCHYMANVLQPEKREDWNKFYLPSWKNQVIDFLSENGDDKLMEEFFHYVNQTDEFHTEMKCWTKVKKPSLFWYMQEGNAPHLAALALRLLYTSANSVASERAFSIMNLLHSKNRNRMSNESVNKLIFIYVNARSLRRARKVKQREEAKATSKIFTEPLTEKEDVEDTLLEMEDSMLIHAFNTENTVLGKRKRVDEVDGFAYIDMY